MPSEYNSFFFLFTAYRGLESYYYYYLYSTVLTVWSAQGWKFALLLTIAHIKEWLWAIRSHCSLKTSDGEQISLISLYMSDLQRIALVALYKRALDFFEKEQCQWFTRDSSKTLSKTIDSPEKTYFSYVFNSFSQFSPFLCLTAKRYHCSSLSPFF